MTPLIPIIYSCRCANLMCVIPYGVCHCGCGRTTTIPEETSRKNGCIKGVPMLFISGHNRTHKRIDTSTEEPFFVESDLCRRVALSSGKCSVVLDKHFAALSKHIWSASWNPGVGAYYAARKSARSNGKPGDSIKMHTAVLELSGLPKPLPKSIGDHINGYTLDNRRTNLRWVNYQKSSINRKTSSRNSSGYKGLCKFQDTDKYVVYINVDGKRIYLGLHLLEQAIAVRKAAEENYHGEFARRE